MQKVLERSTEVVLVKRTRFRWLVLSMVFLVFMLAGADRANIGVVVPYIKDSFKMTNKDIGAMTSLFYIGYAIIQVPIGVYFGKYGIRKLFTLSIVLTSLATFFHGMASSVLFLKLGRVLLGIAEAPMNIGCLSTINRWFPPQEKGVATGVFMAAIKFAPAAVPPLCALIIVMFGWRDVFYFFAIPGFIIAALWFWLVKDDPKDSPFCSESEVEYINASDKVTETVSKTKVIRQEKSLPWLDKIIRARKIQPLDTNGKLIRSWSLWGCAFGYNCMVGITYSIMTWVPTYLVTVKKFSIMKMGFVASAPWVGAVLGNIIGGWLSDKFFEKRRKPVMLLTAASTIIMMYLLIYAPNNPFILGAILLIAGILLNIGYSTFLVYPMGLASKEKVPFASSIVNSVGTLGGAFAPFVVGVILDTYNWNVVFIFLSISSLIALLLVISMIEPMADQEEVKS